MTRKKGWLYSTTCVGVGLIVITVGVLRGLAVQDAAAPLSVFCAPSSVPEGEQWVLLGSTQEDLPKDLGVAGLSAGVAVLEVQRLSDKAVAVRVNTSGGVEGDLLRVQSPGNASEAILALQLRGEMQPLCKDTSFSEDDFLVGQLVVPGEYFMYGFLPWEELPLAAVRIHNRATGVWHFHEIAQEAAAEALREPAVDLDAGLVDSDGDGVPDMTLILIDRGPIPEHLGVKLAPGLNILDIVAVDEQGNVSWKTVDVFSTYVPPEEEKA